MKFVETLILLLSARLTIVVKKTISLHQYKICKLVMVGSNLLYFVINDSFYFLHGLAFL